MRGNTPAPAAGAQIHSHGLLAKNSVLNFAGQIIPLLIGVVCIPYIVRGLGATGFGILSIAWTLLSSFGIFDLGLSRATTKFVAESLHSENSGRLPGLVYTSVALQTGLGVLGGLATAALVPLLIRVFKMPSASLADARLSLYIMAAAVPMLLCSNGVRGVLEAAQRFDLVNYVKVPTSLSFYAVAAIGIPLHWRVSTIVFWSVSIRILTLVAYLSCCFRVFPELKQRFCFVRREVPALMSFGGWVMVSNTAGPIFGYLERFIIASVLSVGVLTYYAVPVDLVSKIVIFPASIAPALFPFFSYHGEREGSVVSDVTSRTLKYLFFVMTPLVAVFAVFARDILTLWMGAEFAGQSAVVLQVVSVSFFVNALAYIPFTSVQALGRPELKAILDLVGLPLYAAYSYALMRYMGLPGAALAKLITTLIDCLVLFWFAWRLKAFSVRDCRSGPLVKGVCASLAFVAVTFLIKSANLQVVQSASLLICAGAAYALLYWMVAIDTDEKVVIKSLHRNLLGSRPSAAVAEAKSQL